MKKVVQIRAEKCKSKERLASPNKEIKMSNKNTYGYMDTNTNVKTAKKAVKKIDAIFSAIKRAGVKGLTCAQVEVRLGFSHGTTSGRIADLEKQGKIANYGVRLTKSGSPSLVWAAR